MYENHSTFSDFSVKGVALLLDLMCTSSRVFDYVMSIPAPSNPTLTQPTCSGATWTGSRSTSAALRIATSWRIGLGKKLPWSRK